MPETKEVYFDQYCPLCQHEKLKDYEDPCNECLDHFWNTDSHKPIFFKEKEE